MASMLKQYGRSSAEKCFKVFASLGILDPSPEASKHRRGTYFYYNRSAIGLACAQAIAMRIDIASTSDRSHQHAEHPLHTSSTSPCMLSTSKHILLRLLLLLLLLPLLLLPLLLFLPHCVVSA